MAAALISLAGAAPAAAGSSTTPSVAASAAPRATNLGPANPGTTICTVSSTAIDSITGMAVTANGIAAVRSGVPSQPPSVQIWTISQTACQAAVKSYGLSPIDPQDITVGADGALWVADIGNGGGSRSGKVALERVDVAKGGQAVPYRIAYPASGPINGRAMLLQADNTPIIIDNAGDKGELYKPDGPLVANVTVGFPKLTKVGEFTPVKTNTPSLTGGFGYSVVTGAAVSPDRSHIVIRTISDAYEFAVGSDGDFVKAITTATPTITPLPRDDGEAISYSADGKQFLTLSGGAKPVLRSYTPYVIPPPTQAAPAGDSGGGGSVSFADITNIAAVVGFAGQVAVVVGIVGIVRARRQYAADQSWDENGYDEYGEGSARGSRPGVSRQRGGRGDGRRSDGREPGRDGQRQGARSRGGAGGGRYGDESYSDEYGRGPRDDDHGRAPYGEPAPAARFGPPGPPMQGPPMQGPPMQGPPMQAPPVQGPPGGPPMPGGPGSQGQAPGPGRGGARPQGPAGGVYGSPRGPVYGGQSGGYGQDNIDT